MLKLQKATHGELSLEVQLQIYHLTKLFKKNASVKANIIDYVQVNTKSMKMDELLTHTMIKFWTELLSESPSQRTVDSLVRTIVTTATDYET